MDAIGRAVTAILRKPEQTSNRTVYISSFEISLNELCAAYKEVTGVSEWRLTYGKTEHGIQEAREVCGTAENPIDVMRAIGLLGLLATIKRGLGGNFVEAGLSDNELLGLPRENAVNTMRQVLNF